MLGGNARVNARKRFTRGSAIDSPSMQHSLLNSAWSPAQAWEGGWPQSTRDGLILHLLSFERVLPLTTSSPPRYRDRCWAAIRLSHRPDPSGRVVGGGSMDRTVEDNMVDGLFFCATLTGRRGGHTPFVQAGAETSDTGAEAVELDPGSSWEGHSGCVCTGVWN